MTLLRTPIYRVRGLPQTRRPHSSRTTTHLRQTKVGAGEPTVNDLRDCTLLETVYQPEHVIGALIDLVNRNALTIG
jgi:hypothetical protein